MTATATKTLAGADVVKLPTARTARAEAADKAGTADKAERREGVERKASAKRLAAVEAAKAALKGKVKVAGRLAALSGSVSAILTSLSLTDLAAGFAHVTMASTAQSTAMATGVDLGFAAAELALIFNVGDDPVLKAFAKAVVGVTLVTSGAMNSFAFSGSPDQTCRCIGIALGLVVPALIGGLNQVCARQVAARSTLAAELAALEG